MLISGGVSYKVAQFSERALSVRNRYDASGSIPSCTCLKSMSGWEALTFVEMITGADDTGSNVNYSSKG